MNKYLEKLANRRALIEKHVRNMYMNLNSAKNIHDSKKNKHEKKASSEQDFVKMNIPLFIRLLEYVREDVKSDAELHKLVERAINIQKSGVAVLGMDNYNKIK